MPEESTTPDPVELSRRAQEALNTGDFDMAMSFYAPDAVFDSVPLGQSFAGVEAIRGFMTELFGGYADFEIEGEEVVDLGNGVVLAVCRQGGRPGGSSGEVRQRLAFVIEWAAELIVRASAYYDIDQARAAAERLAQERG